VQAHVGPDVPCQQDSNCSLSPGGMCTESPTGKWCAYPDPSCASGYRFSDLDVEDSVAATCVPGETPRTATLTVTIDGPGTVASDVNGLECTANTCTGTFMVGTQINLLATPTSDAFLGWSGACAGTGQCTIALVGDTAARAWFGKPGMALWATQFGASNVSTFGQALAHDSNDDLIVAGTFNGTVVLGSTTVTRHA